MKFKNKSSLIHVYDNSLTKGFKYAIMLDYTSFKRGRGAKYMIFKKLMRDAYLQGMRMAGFLTMIFLVIVACAGFYKFGVSNPVATQPRYNGCFPNKEFAFKPGQKESISRILGVRGKRLVEVKSYLSLIEKNAQCYEVDPLLIVAVIRHESNFQPNVVSPKGAQGLMQLMPHTARSVGVRFALNPEQNIKGGCKLLKRLLNKYRNNKRLVLAAYNAGERSVNEYGGIPPFEETENYVEKVLLFYRQIR